MSTEKFDPLAPLESIPGESRKANHALREYCRMGPARSLRKLKARLDMEIKTGLNAYQTKTDYFATFGAFANWSSKYFWAERAAAFDLAEEADRAEKWRERREAIREKDFQTAESLRSLASDILTASPNFIKSTRRRVRGEVKVDRDGNEYREPDTILVTTALDADTMIKLIDLASKLQRAAAGIANNNFVFPVDWSQLTDEQVSAIANGENPLEVLAGGGGKK